MTIVDLVKLFKPGQAFSIQRRALGKYVNKNDTKNDNDIHCRDELVFKGTKDDYLATLYTKYEDHLSKQSLQYSLMKARHLSRSFDVIDYDLDSHTITTFDPDGKLKIS